MCVCVCVCVCVCMTARARENSVGVRGRGGWGWGLSEITRYTCNKIYRTSRHFFADSYSQSYFHTTHVTRQLDVKIVNPSTKYKTIQTNTWHFPITAFVILYLHFNSNLRKRTFWHVRQKKTQITLRMRAAWSESSLSAWRNFVTSAIVKAPSEDSDQTARMRSLIWIFAGGTCPEVRFRTLWHISCIKYNHLWTLIILMKTPKEQIG